MSQLWNYLVELWNYFVANQKQILNLLVEHIQLTMIAVFFAIVIGVPLGILISYRKRLNKPVLGVANVIQAIPSMALLGFAIPLLGIGSLPAIVMVILYSLLPIIKNTYTGLDNINADTLEAAKGIGLTKLQVLTKVQIPIALPVIMAGIRISAVTAVGLMTMAAFIGAGGLGFLVFSGIRTTNNLQIFAGAIPACILALSVDYLVAMIEKMVTPISLQKSPKEQSKKIKVVQKVILATTSAVLLFSIAASFVSSFVKNPRTLVVGSKDFTEQGIVANLIADVVEAHTDISVVRRIDLGGTQICFGALKNGNIDIYVEYSGSAYSDTLNYPPLSDPQVVYDTVKKDLKEIYNIETLQQMAFNNTFVLAVTKETADKYLLKTISDFAKVAHLLTSGTVFEFLNREDGLKGLQKAYGFEMKNAIAIDGGPRYTALINKEIDVIDAFSTDGLLKKYDLVTLKDDKKFFPPYFAMPIMAAEAYKKYPEIIPLIEDLGKVLTEDVMISLNYQVDEMQMTPDVVAKQFLESIGMI